MNDIFRRRYSDEKLRQIFEHVDLDQTGEIDWCEFQAFLKEMDEMAEAQQLVQKAEKNHRMLVRARRDKLYKSTRRGD